MDARPTFTMAAMVSVVVLSAIVEAKELVVAGLVDAAVVVLVVVLVIAVSATVDVVVMVVSSRQHRGTGRSNRSRSGTSGEG